MLNTEIEYAGEEYSIESSFNPFLTGAIRLLTPVNDSNDSDIVIPLSFKDVNKFDKVDYSERLFLWNAAESGGVHKGLRNCTTYYMSNLGQLTDTRVEVTNYPMCHNALLVPDNNWTIDDNTLDINWESAVPFSVDGSAATVAFNLFDTYYKGYIDALYFPDTVLIDTSVRLTPEEFADLNLYAPVILDNSRYRILNYRGYDVVDDRPVKMLLVKDNFYNPVIGTLPKLATPTNLNIGYDTDTDTISGSWDAVPDATHYRVRIYWDGAIIQIITVTSPNFTKYKEQGEGASIWYKVNAQAPAFQDSAPATSPTYEVPETPGSIVSTRAFRNTQACVFEGLTVEDGLNLYEFETWRKNPSGSLILGWDFEFSADPVDVFEIQVPDANNEYVWAKSDGTVSAGTDYWDAPTSSYDSGSKTWSIRITNNNPIQSTFEGEVEVLKAGSSLSTGTFQFNGTSCSE
jgi:hypothetical protein